MLKTDTQARLAFYYCSKNRSSEENTSNGVLRSLLRQAAYDRIDGKFNQNVIDAYNGGEIFPKNKTDCKELLKGVLQGGFKLTILIDALDECVESEELLETLAQHRDATPGRIRLLVTGRPNVNVRNHLHDAFRFNIDADDTQDEMRDFVKKWIEALHPSRKLLGGRPEYLGLERQLIELICQKSNGMLVFF